MFRRKNKFKNFQANNKYSLTKSEKAQYLIIVESPSKCSKIESFLGPRYQCIASRGHLCGISSLKSIHKDRFEVDYHILDSKKEHVEQMRQVISQFLNHNIFLACDDDREGEAIAWHITTLFRLPLTTPRIVFHEITQNAVLQAIKNPRKIDMATVWSQRARQVIDLMVGFRVSPMLWRFIFSDRNEPLSAGRCQSAALRLIYENAKTNFNISSETSRKATFYISSRNIPFTLSSQLVLHSKQDCWQWLSPWRNCENWSLSEIAPKTRIVSPPVPLTTARLLQQYTHMSPHTVMELCQILYQEGHITYMRTDSTQYSMEFINQCREYLTENYTEEGHLDESRIPSLTSVTSPSLSASSPAHEAIRVTHLSLRTISHNDARLNTLYQFIWRATLQSCMKPAVYSDHLWILNPVEAKYTVEFLKHPGWMLVDKSSEYFREKLDDASGLQLYLKTIQNPKPEKIALDVIIERPPRHYSESAMIHQLEKLGIGRPSTFASIVQTLSDRGYVQKGDIAGTQQKVVDICWERKGDRELEKERSVWVGKEQGKLLLQPIGERTCEFLLEHFTDLLSYDYTSHMETALDNVQIHETPSEAYISLCRQCDDDLKKWMKPLQKLTKAEAPRILDSTDGQEYEYKTTSKGGYLRNTQTGECKPIRESIQVDLKRLENGHLDAADLLEFPGNSDVLGEYQGETVKFHKSKFGWFLKWGEDKTIPIPERNIHEITMDQVSQWISEKEGKTDSAVRSPPPPPGSLRVINSVISIRQGKFGPYVYNVATKSCTSLRKFRGDFMHCSENDILAFLQQGVKVT